MLLLAASLLWVISITNVHEGKDVPSAPPGVQAPPEEKSFSTYSQCMKVIDVWLAQVLTVHRRQNVNVASAADCA